MICEKCGCNAMGFDLDAKPGEPSLCSDCAFPALTNAFAAARKAMEEQHFNRTGVRKTAGELCRQTLGM